MVAKPADPVHDLEHSHGHLTKAAVEIGRLVRTGESRDELVDRLDVLREELLQHFAKEEEGLFPFLLATFPAKADAVLRLSAAHDSICGALVRLSHLVARDPEAATAALVALYERFEEAYGKHSQDEATLLGDLGRTLSGPQRAQLAELLRGL
jgi:iron-sulfur cluster repair protein YtfE (RIC family)